VLVDVEVHDQKRPSGQKGRLCRRKLKLIVRGLCNEASGANPNVVSGLWSRALTHSSFLIGLTFGEIYSAQRIIYVLASVLSLVSAVVNMFQLHILELNDATILCLKPCY